MVPIVRGRQYLLFFVMLYSIAFPWACMRHCAIAHAHLAPNIQYVCDMHSVKGALNSSITTPSNTFFAPPVVTQFLLTIDIIIAIALLVQPLVLCVFRSTSHFHDMLTPPPKFLLM